MIYRNVDALIGRDSNLTHQQDEMEEISYDDTLIYFGYVNQSIGSDFMDWKQSIHAMAHDMETADVVILGVGNSDLFKIRQSPMEFAQGFILFLNYMMTLYGDQRTFIIKTTGWMSGRYYGKSDAYANVIRSVVSHLNSDRVLLWDTYRFGMNASKNRNYVVAIENRVLQSMFCQLPL
jgi:hypothetical protein